MNTTANHLDTHFRVVDGVRVRCADSGGHRRPTILLTSPWPESLHAFATIWATLSQHMLGSSRSTSPASVAPTTGTT